MEAVRMASSTLSAKEAARSLSRCRSDVADMGTGDKTQSRDRSIAFRRAGVDKSPCAKADNRCVESVPFSLLVKSKRILLPREASSSWHSRPLHPGAHPTRKATLEVLASRSGGMADAADSKSAVRKGVRVRVPPSVLSLTRVTARVPSWVSRARADSAKRQGDHDDHRHDDRDGEDDGHQTPQRRRVVARPGRRDGPRRETRRGSTARRRRRRLAASPEDCRRPGT